MSSNRIRMGVSGLGRIGWPFHCAQIAAHAEFEFVAVQDLEPARREEAERTYGVRSYESFRDMLRESRLDAVAIATPTHLHRQMTVEALRAGCHVMLEKPMAPNSGDAAAIVREAARCKRILTVYQPRRAEAYFQHLRALIGAGLIGTLYHVRFGLFQFTIRNDWQALRRFGGGILNNYGAHALDQLLQLVGYDVKHLFCNLRIVASVGDAEDVAKVVLETGDGVVGEVDINQASPTSPYFIDAWGTLGTISIPSSDLDTLVVRRFEKETVPRRSLEPALASAGRKYPEVAVPFKDERIPVDKSRAVDVYADLARAITTGAPAFVQPEEPLAVMKLIDRCREEAQRIVLTPIVGVDRPSEPAGGKAPRAARRRAGGKRVSARRARSRKTKPASRSARRGSSRAGT
jgi:predicted dehydrogenase